MHLIYCPSVAYSIFYEKRKPFYFCAAIRNMTFPFKLCEYFKGFGAQLIEAICHLPINLVSYVLYLHLNRKNRVSASFCIIHYFFQIPPRWSKSVLTLFYSHYILQFSYTCITLMVYTNWHNNRKKLIM